MGRYALVRMPGRWWLVGEVEDIHSEGIVLSRACVVRRFGTKAGIGEILMGPTKATQLDPIAGRIHIDRGPGVWRIDAGDGWAAHMPEVKL